MGRACFFFCGGGISELTVFTGMFQDQEFHFFCGHVCVFLKRYDFDFKDLRLI